MDVLGRDRAPFSGRVWQQIDAAVAAVRASSCIGRRYLEVDGPYGMGLTTLSGDDFLLDAGAAAGPRVAWDVPNVVRAPSSFEEPLGTGARGSFLVQAPARPVPLIAGEFVLGVRNVEAFEDDCQPLDVSRAVRAARAVALEEERFLFYGNEEANQAGFLTPSVLQLRSSPLLDQTQLPVPAQFAVPEPIRQQLLRPTTLAAFLATLPQLRQQSPAALWPALRHLSNPATWNFTPFTLPPPGGPPLAALNFMQLQGAIQALAGRGFGGPYALLASPGAYLALHAPIPGTNALVSDVARELCTAGVQPVPVINPALAGPFAAGVAAARSAAIATGFVIALSLGTPLQLAAVVAFGAGEQAAANPLNPGLAAAQAMIAGGVPGAAIPTGLATRQAQAVAQAAAIVPPGAGPGAIAQAASGAANIWVFAGLTWLGFPGAVAAPAAAAAAGLATGLALAYATVPPGPAVGAIISCGRAYARLILGQDWAVAYRGTDGGGVYHRFLILTSARLEITEPGATQILVAA